MNNKSKLLLLIRALEHTPNPDPKWVTMVMSQIIRIAITMNLNLSALFKTLSERLPPSNWFSLFTLVLLRIQHPNLQQLDVVHCILGLIHHSHKFSVNDTLLVRMLLGIADYIQEPFPELFSRFPNFLHNKFQHLVLPAPITKAFEAAKTQIFLKNKQYLSGIPLFRTLLELCLDTPHPVLLEFALKLDAYSVLAAYVARVPSIDAVDSSINADLLQRLWYYLVLAGNTDLAFHPIWRRSVGIFSSENSKIRLSLFMLDFLSSSESDVSQSFKESVLSEHIRDSSRYFSRFKLDPRYYSALTGANILVDTFDGTVSLQSPSDCYLENPLSVIA